MKLRGSLTEQKVREELVSSQRGVLAQHHDSKLSGKLRELFPELRTACVLSWTPEQSEDIFDVLVDGEKVVSLQIPKADEAPTVSVQPVQAYARGLRGRPDLMRLAIALDLARTQVTDAHHLR